MIVLGLCPRCGTPRVRSVRDLNPGDKLDPEDFEGIDDHPAPEPGIPMACADCSTPLIFRRDPASPAPPTAPLTSTNGHAPTTTTLFSAEPNEDVVSIQAVGPTRYLIHTTRRLLIVDLTAYLDPPHGGL